MRESTTTPVAEERAGLPEDRRARSRSEGKARTLLKVAGTSAVLGLLLSVSGDDAIGRWLMLLGLVLLVLGLHRFGRLGPDGP